MLGFHITWVFSQGLEPTTPWQWVKQITTIMGLYGCWLGTLYHSIKLIKFWEPNFDSRHRLGPSRKIPSVLMEIKYISIYLPFPPWLRKVLHTDCWYHETRWHAMHVNISSSSSLFLSFNAQSQMQSSLVRFLNIKNHLSTPTQCESKSFWYNRWNQTISLSLMYLPVFEYHLQCTHG